jgi:cell division septation protein DedD
MVAEGQGDAGRALVQQQMDAAPPGSPRYVEALYWRAVLASTAADAERDLKRVVIEFSLSPRADDALMRLAQLELARGDRDQAVAHLDRLVLEHPNSPTRARASYWMARALFEEKKDGAACARLVEARRSASAGDIELRNQIDYYSPRCAGMDTLAAAQAPASAARGPQPAPTSPSPTTRSSVTSPATAATAATATAATAATTATPTTPAPPAPTASAPTASGGTSDGPPATPTSKTAAPPPKTGAPPVAKSSASPPTAAAGTNYTIQLAAYTTRDEAVKLQSRLQTRGITTRVYGTSSPYRVRMGRYPTRAAADAEAQRLKSAKMDCFVTEAEAP